MAGAFTRPEVPVKWIGAAGYRDATSPSTSIVTRSL